MFCLPRPFRPLDWALEQHLMNCAMWKFGVLTFPAGARDKVFWSGPGMIAKLAVLTMPRLSWR